MTHYNVYVLILGNVANIEDKVSELMAPYNANLEGLPYPRECECVYDSAIKRLKKGQYAMHGRVNGPVVEFFKQNFEKSGPEIIQKLELLRLGTPNPRCEDCRGSGMSFTNHNCRTQWDNWDMGLNVTAGALKDCIESSTGLQPDQWIVPVKSLNLGKVPLPGAVLTPDGEWHTHRKYIWFSNAVIIDNNWEHTFKNLLAAYPDATLVVVDCHI